MGWFNQIGFPMHKFGNPADHFMKIMTFHHPMTEEESARFDTLKTNYSKLKSIEITNENKEL
jgi:hypothetical protein